MTVKSFAEAVMKEVSKNLSNLLAFQKKEWMNIREASIYTGLGVQKLRDVTATGDIPAYKPGRDLLYKKSDLDEWIEQSKMDIPKVA